MLGVWSSSLGGSSLGWGKHTEIWGFLHQARWLKSWMAKGHFWFRYSVVCDFHVQVISSCLLCSFFISFFPFWFTWSLMSLVTCWQSCQTKIIFPLKLDLGNKNNRDRDFPFQNNWVKEWHPGCFQITSVNSRCLWNTWNDTDCT